MKVCCITASAGRATCLSRSLRMFLEQDYENCIQLIYQNSQYSLKLSKDVPKDRVILINHWWDDGSPVESPQPYKTLGAIYNDVLKHIPDDVDVLTHMDDDDVFFPNHVSEGVKGLIRGGKTAYKPQFSYFISPTDLISKIDNNMEPSIFVKKEHVQKYGYWGGNNVASHFGWLNPLIEKNDIFVDKDGPSTMIYDWNTTGMPPIFKTSGSPDNPKNMDNYRRNSTDYGDGVLTPMGEEEVKKYYKVAK